MRTLILYANPVASSYGAALHKQVIQSLRINGHQVDDCDLYAEFFDPVMSQQDRTEYHDTTINRMRVSCYAEHVLDAEALVLIYPVWNEGFPAILKGFFDRVFIPGVSSPRRIVKRLLRATSWHHVTCEYIAHYNMNRSTPERRAAFIRKVQLAFEAW